MTSNGRGSGARGSQRETMISHTSSQKTHGTSERVCQGTSWTHGAGSQARRGQNIRGSCASFVMTILAAQETAWRRRAGPQDTDLGLQAEACSATRRALSRQHRGRVVEGEIGGAGGEKGISHRAGQLEGRAAAQPPAEHAHPRCGSVGETELEPGW